MSSPFQFWFSPISTVLICIDTMRPIFLSVFDTTRSGLQPPTSSKAPTTIKWPLVAYINLWCCPPLHLLSVCLIQLFLTFCNLPTSYFHPDELQVIFRNKQPAHSLRSFTFLTIPRRIEIEGAQPVVCVCFCSCLCRI
jgi:hypothetical protein